jgi:acyl-coenzyme A synthetase/AMP-(fatty) acid ligase
LKKLRIGRRRGKGESHALSPLELALVPALEDGRWQVPDRFNFTRDVVESLAGDPRRRALTFIGEDGIIEPRTFHVLSERAARWSSLLRERDVRPGDPVLVLSGTSVDWIEIVLACLKVGAVVVPGPATLSAETLDVRLERTGASLVVAERAAAAEIERTTNRPLVLYVDDARALLEEAPDEAATHDTSARDLALVVETPGTGGNPKLVGHSHGAVFAARVAAEHWLEAGRGDAVWCPAAPGSSESIWHSLVGPWSRGAELLVHDGAFDPLERLDLIYRLGVTVLCQTPAEYAALANLRELGRSRPPQLRRLVSTGEWLDPGVAATFEETWGLTIHDGFGQAETNVVVASGAGAGSRPGSLGLPLPGHQVAVIDEHGNELPPGVEGELAVRGRPPTLFAGYWESPEQTKAAFRGDWYVTGDLAKVDDDGFIWFVGRASDVITSRGESFGPYDVERALRAHEAVAECAVVGIHDLERGGQFVRAFVVLTPGARARESEHLEAELRVELGETLPEHEVPREIEFVDELPTAPGGKLRRLELRERHVVGRPLWDLSQTSEPEPDPWAGMLDTSTLDADPEPALEPEARPSLDEAILDYLAEPAAEPEPQPEPASPDDDPATTAAATEPQPRGEAAQDAVPQPRGEAAQDAAILPGPERPDPTPPQPHREPEPLIEPERDLPREPEPTPPLPPELVPEPEPEPEQEAVALVEQEPTGLAEEEIEPEPEVPLEPDHEEPVAEVQQDVATIPTDVWVPVVTEPAPEPERPTPPDLLPEPEPAPAITEDAATATAAATEPQPRGEAAQETQPRGEAAPERQPRGEAAQSTPLTAEAILNPPPPPGPLPDFIIDPDQQSDAAARSPQSVAKPEEHADEPVLEDLGPPALTEFPSLPTLPTAGRTITKGDDRDDAERTRGPTPDRAGEESEPRSPRGQSASDPGDLGEPVDWRGLSSRLSAYSLASDDSVQPRAEDDADDAEDADDD